MASQRNPLHYIQTMNTMGLPRVHLNTIPAVCFEGNTLQELMDSLHLNQHIPIPYCAIDYIIETLSSYSEATVSYWYYTIADSFINVDRVSLTGCCSQESFKCVVEHHYACADISLEEHQFDYIPMEESNGDVTLQPYIDWLQNQMKFALEEYSKTEFLQRSKEKATLLFHP